MSITLQITQSIHRYRAQTTTLVAHHIMYTVYIINITTLVPHCIYPLHLCAPVPPPLGAGPGYTMKGVSAPLSGPHHSAKGTSHQPRYDHRIKTLWPINLGTSELIVICVCCMHIANLHHRQCISLLQLDHCMHMHIHTYILYISMWGDKDFLSIPLH